MNNHLTIKKIITSIFVGIVFFTARSTYAVPLSNIVDSQKYSQAIGVDIDNNGTDDFINWKPTGSGAIIYDTEIQGHIWGESLGWINLQPTGSGVTVNCTTGVLGGKAWSSIGGWINFAPTGVTVQPNINLTTGVISGQIWVSGVHGGWYDLSSSDGTHPGLQTTWSGCGSNPAPEPTPDPEPTPGTHSGSSPSVVAPVVSPITSPVVPAPGPVSPSPIPTNSGGGGSGGSSGSSGSMIGGLPLKPFFPQITAADIQKRFSDIQTERVIQTAVTIIAAVGVASSLPGLAPRFANILLTFLLARKKMRGIVYDSKTKEPLDPAYVSVIDMATGQEIVNMITDMEGRYGFVLKKGSYKLVANKTHYQFPSTILAGKTQDEIYDHLYFGDVFTVENDEQVVTWNIPMDALETDWNQEEKRRMNIMRWFTKNPKLSAWLFSTLFAIGFFVSIVITYFYPVWWNIVILGVYLVIALVQIMGWGAVHPGKITKNGKPLQGAIVRVFGVTLNREIAHKVTSDLGGYYVLVPKADYYITIEQKNDDGTYTKIYTSSVMSARHGLINKSFDL